MTPCYRVRGQGGNHSRPLDGVAAQANPPLAPAPLQPVDITSARDPVRLVAVAPDEEVIGLGMGDIAVDIATVVHQVVMRRRLPLFVQS